MRSFVLAAVVVCGAMLAGAAGANAEGMLTTLPQPRPAWLTDQLEAKIVAAGTKGFTAARLRADCAHPLGI